MPVGIMVVLLKYNFKSGQKSWEEFPWKIMGKTIKFSFSYFCLFEWPFQETDHTFCSWILIFPSQTIPLYPRASHNMLALGGSLFYWPRCSFSVSLWITTLNTWNKTLASKKKKSTKISNFYKEEKKAAEDLNEAYKPSCYTLLKKPLLAANLSDR